MPSGASSVIGTATRAGCADHGREQQEDQRAHRAEQHEHPSPAIQGKPAKRCVVSISQ